MAVPQGLLVLAQIWCHGGSCTQILSVLLTPPPSPSLLIPTIAVLHICQHLGDVLCPSMSWGAPEPQGCPCPAPYIIGAALLLSLHLSVLQQCPVSISAVRMAHTHLGCGFSPCLFLPWGCPHPTTPWDCSMSICPTVFLCMPGDVSPDLLAATACALPAASTVHISWVGVLSLLCWGCQGPLWLGGPPGIP